MATILCVDDDESILSVLQTVLESNSHAVLSAQSGQAALDLVRQHHPELVISDIRMSPMSGMDLLRTLRQERPELPVIMLTAFTSPETIRESRELGATDHLSKPFTTQEVIKAVQRVLSAHEHEPHPACLAITDIVREYMVREHLSTLFDAKTALADELFWASEKYDKEKVLSAMKEALGQTDIPHECIDMLLSFRGAMLRLKQMTETAAAQGGDDAITRLEKASQSIAGPDAKGDYAARVKLVAEALGTEADKITSEDVAILREYAEHLAAKARPAGSVQEPEPPKLNDGLDKRIAAFTSVELQQLYATIRFGPVLSEEQIESLGKAFRNLRGRSEPVCKALRAILKDHKSLATVGSLVPRGAPQLLADLKMTEPELQQLMNSLNAVADRGHVLLRLKELIESSTEKTAMAAFWVKYWKKRYSDEF